MDPIQVWLANQKKKPNSVGSAAGGIFGGAASGGNVTPVVPNAPVFTPNPTVPLGAFTPDYGALIKSDPSYLAYKASGQLDISQAAAQRRSMLQRLAIQFGGLPAGLKDQFGDIDQGTLELAGKNQFSDTQRLQRSYSEGIEAFKKSLAARGALQSGDTGHGLAQADLARGEREYDLGNQFANAAQGVVNDFVGVESRVRQGEAGLLSQAQANVYSNPVNRPVDAYDAPLVAGSVEQYGQPLYQGNDGKMYTAAGQAFDPAAAPASTSGAAAGDDGGIWMRDPVTGQLVQVPAGYVFQGGETGLF